MNNQPIVLALKHFMADFEKQDGHNSRFSIFVLNFLFYYNGCLIATVFNLSGEINYYKRWLKNFVFRTCVYVCTGSVGYI